MTLFSNFNLLDFRIFGHYKARLLSSGLAVLTQPEPVFDQGQRCLHLTSKLFKEYHENKVNICERLENYPQNE